MKQGLHLKASQQLSLTPQLRRSLEILQLSSQALEQSIIEELAENPLLERDESPTSKNEEVAAEVLPAEEQEWHADLDVRRTSSQGLSADNPLESTVANHESLRDHLLEQMHLTSISDRDTTLATLIIDSLDEDGYFVGSCTELATLCPVQLEVDASELRAMLSLVQSLEPAGVGARNLSDRLKILLRRLSAPSQDREVALDLVENHLDALAQRKFDQLRRSLEISREQLSDAITLITSLNPRIAGQFSPDQREQITPDILVHSINGRWEAKLNPEIRAHLRVNEEYAKLSGEIKDAKGSSFIDNHLSNAKTFIKSVNSRYDTLLRVAKIVVAHQQAFFQSGTEHLTPLTRRQIADDLELHDSTISRALAGKYLQCPSGVFELGYFFSSSVDNADGSTTSSTVIRNLIRKLVETEPQQKPLSDSKIAQQLKLQGHVVARRTVAKYRESMHIAPSSQRKSL